MLERLLGDDTTDAGRYVSEVVYGANDGIVTTFAVVSGVAGASLRPSIVLVLGAANLLADGFSMGVSNYLSERARRDYERERERPTPRRTPAGARRATTGDGTKETNGDRATTGDGTRDTDGDRATTGDRTKETNGDRATTGDGTRDTDDHREDPGGKSPRRTALVTFLAFVTAGWAPLVPYVFAVRAAFPVSVAATGVAFFLVGTSRTLVTGRSWLRNGVEMLLVGMAAAVVAFVVGFALRGVA